MRASPRQTSCCTPLLPPTHTHLPATTPQTIDGFDAVLSAIGRKPVTEALQLEKAGVKVDAQGLVQVDAFENTSAPTLANLTLTPTPTPTPAPTWSRWMPSRTPRPPMSSRWATARPQASSSPPWPSLRGAASLTGSLAASPGR